MFEFAAGVIVGITLTLVIVECRLLGEAMDERKRYWARQFDVAFRERMEERLRQPVIVPEPPGEGQNQ